jgi:hypothetical protein
MLQRRTVQHETARATGKAFAGRHGHACHCRQGRSRVARLLEAEDKRHKELKAEITGLDGKIARQGRGRGRAQPRRPSCTPAMGDGAYEDRARQFSLVKAINARLGEDVDAGFEREISAEVRAVPAALSRALRFRTSISRRAPHADRGRRRSKRSIRRSTGATSSSTCCARSLSPAAWAQPSSTGWWAIRTFRSRSAPAPRNGLARTARSRRPMPTSTT